MGSAEAEAIETVLDAVGAAGIDIVPGLFQRFFESFPDEAHNFYVPEASYGRMANETLQLLTGVATGEAWAPVMAASLVDLHRNFGQILLERYRTYVSLVVDIIGETAGETFTAEREKVWRAAGAGLMDLIEAEIQRTEVVHAQG